MSRLYEALQRSQGETPSASPLATPPPEVPGAQLPGLPIDDTAALDALATQAPPAAAWLAVPPERILRRCSSSPEPQRFAHACRRVAPA